MNLEPGFDAFRATYESGEGQILWTTVPADLDTPVSLMLKLGHGRRDCFLLESVKIDGDRGRYSSIGLKPDLIWRCRDGKAEVNRSARIDPEAFAPDPKPALESLRALMAESRLPLPEGLPPMVAGLFGYLGYDMIRQVERLPEPPEDRLGLPDAILLRPTIMAVVDHARDVVIFATPVRPSPGVDAQSAYERAAERLGDAVEDIERGLPYEDVDRRAFDEGQAEPQPNMTPEAYRAIVAKAQDYIRAGDIFQVVLSQRWRRPFKLPPFSFYRALRRTNPSSYMFFFDFGAFQIAGASPEILVTYTPNEIKLRPIAGTRPRGATPEEDRRLEAELLADPKERAEHLMLLDLGRNDVGRVAKVGTVRPTETFTIERYSHVMHIVSHVTGVPRADVDALDVFLAGMPAGTVSGAPKIRAMEIIDELEVERRGVYAGGVGYFAANGEMDACIAIRTALFKDGEMITQAGGGVVYDSDSEMERQETINKARAPARAAEEAIRHAGDKARNRR